MRTRAPLLYLAWTHVGGRSAEIAADLGGEACNIYYPALGSGWRVIPRYALSAVATVATLLRRRPRAVIVTNPPIFPAVFVWLWCAVSGARFVLDSHPASFGLKDNRIAEFFLPVHRFLARRAAGVAVTTDELGAQVTEWGGDPLLVHEAPPVRVPDRVAPRVDGTPEVLFVCTFARDEPWEAVLEAAELLGDDARVLVTGRPEKVPAATRATLADNVELVGFLDPDAYLDTVAASDIVLSLTTEPESVMRSAYEAVYLSRPLVVTDTVALRSVFPHATFCTNDAASIAAAVRSVLDDLVAYHESASEALESQQKRWKQQREQLLCRLRHPQGDR